MTVETSEPGKIGPLDFPPVEWSFISTSFSWAAIQHSIYFRSTFNIPETGTYLISFAGVDSFKIDSKSFVGNVYNADHAADSAIYLEEGEHSIYVQYVHDVRRNGGNTPPEQHFYGKITLVSPNDFAGIIYYHEDAIMPEILDGKLTSTYASVAIRNAIKVPVVNTGSLQMKDAAGWKQIIKILVYGPDGQPVPVSIPTLFTIMIAPGQIVAVPFEFDTKTGIPSDLSVFVQILDLDSESILNVPVGRYKLTERKWGESYYKITMIGFDSTVQYTYLKPPRKGCIGYENQECPVIVALHGSGVKVSYPVWLDAINSQDHAWVVYPSGRTPWGFDWHGPSALNIDASVQALKDLPGVPSDLKGSMRAATDRLIMVGHSSGGYGAWWYLGHNPDRIIAALPAAGFLKIQLYVSYNLHLGYGYADPMLRGILESSISQNDLDLYASNMGSVPILARSGSDDDNVPPFHTRRLMRMIDEWSGHANTINYVEDKGKGHWYDGILNDDIAQNFLNNFVDPTKNPTLDLPPLPNPFTFSTMNPGSSGSRGGIRILQLEVPFRLAKVTVEKIGDHWKISTTNVRRLGFVRDKRQEGINSYSIDDTHFIGKLTDAGLSYLKVGRNTWEVNSDLLWINRERSPTTYGPVSQIFEQPFRIVIPSSPTANLTMYREMAEHIANAWYIYARGSTQIVRDVDIFDGLTAKYNLIVLGDPRDNYYTMKRSAAGAELVSFLPNGGMKIAGNVYEEPGTGALFLAPSPARTRLCLFITGIDADGLWRAVWTLPFQTGVQVADYTVIGSEYGDPSSGWTAKDNLRTKGIGGILASGYWDNNWAYSNSSGYLK